ncbi:hypothetical protein B0T22DRAFT_12688 [Podospora appendiculata]|uniref:Uncharacterized protein n=1 Tax=Podospora appendiculata TaxID=314037 RepID=A0AAE0XFB8_9PEZI|nr:hypothetical protein B0T22DRAFT_12688 [Podospora appendiculata]
MLGGWRVGNATTRTDPTATCLDCLWVLGGTAVDWHGDGAHHCTQETRCDIGEPPRWGDGWMDIVRFPGLGSGVVSSPSSPERNRGVCETVARYPVGHRSVVLADRCWIALSVFNKIHYHERARCGCTWKMGVGCPGMGVWAGGHGPRAVELLKGPVLTGRYTSVSAHRLVWCVDGVPIQSRIEGWTQTDSLPRPRDDQKTAEREGRCWTSQGRYCVRLWCNCPASYCCVPRPRHAGGRSRRGPPRAVGVGPSLTNRIRWLNWWAAEAIPRAACAFDRIVFVAAGAVRCSTRYSAAGVGEEVPGSTIHSRFGSPLE